MKKTRTELELELLGSGNEATYLVVLELEVKACDEHDLGEVERVLRSLCGCKAGNGACVHKGMACIMQVGPAMPPTPLSAQLSLSVGGLSQEHHWSPMRGTSRPITQDLQGWGGAAAKYKAERFMPVCALTCQVVVAHHVDKAYRLCREGSLHGRTYPLFADQEDEDLLASLTIADFDALFDQIAVDNGAKAPTEEECAEDGEGDEDRVEEMATDIVD